MSLGGLLGGLAGGVGGFLLGGPAGALSGFGIGSSLAGSGSQQSGTQTVQQQVDPRIGNMLFGDGTEGNQGLLNQYRGYFNQPQSAGSAAIGGAAQDWLKNQGGNTFNQLQAGASGLLGSNISAPQATASQSASGAMSAGGGLAAAPGAGNVLWNKGETFSAPQAMQAAQSRMPQQVRGATIAAPGAMQAAQMSAPNAMQSAQSTAAQAAAPSGYNAATAQASRVEAPSQNNIDLSGAYQNFISGQSGNNPYLNSALQAGVDATNAGYSKNVNTLTDQLQRTILPGIRTNSVLAGQYGGTRQGIAEGNAISDYTRQLADNNAQLAATNSANLIGAQAQAYNQGQDRALSATQGLGAQQYGVAMQNSAQQQQANLANAAAQNAASQQQYQGLLSTAQSNAANQQQVNLANQSANQQANQTNFTGQLQANQQNASNQQQANQTNYGGLLQMATQNAANQQQANLANQSANLQQGISNAQLQQQANQTNYTGQLQTNQQNAANLQQANLANQNWGNQTAQFNAQQQMQAGLANQASTQQNNQFNAQLGQQNNQFNAQLGNQTSLANLQSLLSTNGLNSSNQQAGMQGLSGLLSQIYGMGTNQDNWSVNRATQVNGLLAPYIGVNSSTSSPIYSNTGANLLGGATAGIGLYNGLRNAGLLSGSGNSINTVQSPFPTAPAGYWGSDIMSPYNG